MQGKEKTIVALHQEKRSVTVTHLKRGNMIIVRYKSIIIDGLDKTGQTEQVSEEIAERLILQGYAELVDVVEAIPDIPQAVETERLIKEPKPEIRDTEIQEPEDTKIRPEEDTSEWKPGDADNLMPIPERKPKKGKR